MIGNVRGVLSRGFEALIVVIFAAAAIGCHSTPAATAPVKHHPHIKQSCPLRNQATTSSSARKNGQNGACLTWICSIIA